MDVTVSTICAPNSDHSYNKIVRIDIITTEAFNIYTEEKRLGGITLGDRNEGRRCFQLCRITFTPGNMNMHALAR